MFQNDPNPTCKHGFSTLIFYKSQFLIIEDICALHGQLKKELRILSLQLDK